MRSLASLCRSSLLALALASSGFVARAAAQAATAPVAPSATLQRAASAQGAASAIPTSEELLRAQEVLRLRLRQQELLARNRRWQAPAVGFALGATTYLVGAAVMATWTFTGSCGDSESDCDATGRKTRPGMTGLVMMPVGAGLALAFAPMFVLRLVRHKKLKNTERALARLGQHASWGAGRAALTLRF